MITLPSDLDRKRFLTGLTIAIVGAVLFSTKAIVAKLIYRHGVDAVTLIAFRMLFSVPVFGAIALWQMRKGPPLSWPDRWRLLFMGLTGYYLSSMLDFLGLQYIGVGLERLILFLTPSFVLLITVFLFKRRVRPLEWLALFICYAGIALVFAEDLKIGGPDVALGAALVLGAALAYAIYLLQSGEMVKRVGTLRLVAYAMCVSSFACIAQFFILRPAVLLFQQPAPVYWLSLVNALFCTVLPVSMTMMAVARIGAGSTSQASMIGPVSTLFLGALVLDEAITVLQLGGTALVLAGIYLLSRKRSDA
ncbi:MAG TPA: DMT family transporter [Burkholderiaceae bacterium]